MNISFQFKVLSGLCCLIFLLVQQSFAQPFNQVTEVPVFKDEEQLVSAWAGGLNAPQFSKVDLNNDGKLDIFVFDKDSKRSFSFIYTQGDQYIFEPSYALNFPTINSWVVLADYNCDGVSDLLTHTAVSPKTFLGYYENNILKFKADKDIIYYQGFTAVINLNMGLNHRPLLLDMNKDGDIDILAFASNTLSKLVYYENMRVENNLPCDSLFFKAADRCWGNFKETGGLTLDVILGDTCNNKYGRLIDPLDDMELSRHPGGAAIALYDNGNNGVYDLLLGDATYERLNYIKNNGTTIDANFYTQDDSFPSYDEMVKIQVFPAPYMMDVDDDGDEDLLAAPFIHGAISNHQNVWLYKNDGSSDEPFSLAKKNFIVGDMIDVGEFSDPTFYDENKDGLLDLVIGNGGYLMDDGDYLNSLTLYRNTGTLSKPKFTFVEDNYLNLNQFDINELAPSFADIDGDNDDDLICGELKGRLLIMDNNNGNFENPRFLKDNNNIEIDVVQSSDPAIFDFNEDGLLDLIIGCRNGNVYYYENTGSATNFEFTLRTDSLGKVTSKDNQTLGFSSPSLGDFDNDGNIDLLLGGFKPGLNFYSNIGTDFNTSFTISSTNYLEETNFSEISTGFYPKMKPTSVDISGDGLPELIVGISNGGLLMYSQDSSIQDTNTLITEITQLQIVNDQILVYPNPTSSIINIDWNTAFNNESQIELSVFNIVGKLIKSERIIHQNSIYKLDLTNFPSGIYMLSVSQENKLGSVPLVKY